MPERNYYYLVAGLPDITVDEKKLPLSLTDLKEELQIHLHPSDYKLVQDLFLVFDNQNLLQLIDKKDFRFNELSNFPLQQLEEELKEPVSLPEYMQKYIQSLNEDELNEDSKLSPENRLTALYFEEMTNHHNDFLKEWFVFIRDINNILAIYNSRKFGLEISTQMVGRYELTENALKNTSREFGLASELPYINTLISISETEDILKQEMSVDRLKWDYLEELNVFHYFTIEKILAFVIKLMMLDRWSKLESEQGRAFFNELLTDLKQSFQLPKEFRLHEKRRQTH